jgi:hypothetical protein
MLNQLNPGSILNKNKSDYIIDFLLTECDDTNIYIDDKNKKKCTKIIVPGNHEQIILNYEINKDNLKNKNAFGIILYNNENTDTYYGSNKNIPKFPNEISEPIRIILDKDIHNELLEHFKKLIFVNTDYNYYDFKENKISELVKFSNTYKSLFNKYKTNDTEGRNFTLYGKFYDAMHAYQEYNLDIDKEYIKNLIMWYETYNKLQIKLAQNICNILNTYFHKDAYYFQHNNPVRISIENSIGTPLHQDTQSALIKNTDINKFKDSIYEPKKRDDDHSYIETTQNDCIFNCCYSLFEEYPSQNMYICEHDIEEMQQYEKTYFYQVKPNLPNEAILFNPSNRLHFRQNQYKGLSIRGDIRIVSINNYNKNTLFKYRGPRLNLNVCFGNLTDAKKEKVDFGVFSDIIFE